MKTGVLISEGNSQGMNAAIISVARQSTDDGQRSIDYAFKFRNLIDYDFIV